MCYIPILERKGRQEGPVSGLLSGRWRGSYEQAGKVFDFGLSLVVHPNGTVSGSGQDDDIAVFNRDGFNINGIWDPSGHTVRFEKSYVGGNDVLYQGTFDSNNIILGKWTLGSTLSGTFALVHNGGRKG